MKRIKVELTISDLVLIRQFLIEGLKNVPAETFTAQAITDLLNVIISTIQKTGSEK